MSNTENRKSMDDVLASIRRIVRAEKEPGPAPAAGAPDERWGEPAGRAGGGRGDEPLALTPEMRTDSGPVESEADSHPARSASPAEAEESGEAAAPAGGAASHATRLSGGAAALPDREALRRLVREILLEELTQGPAEGAIRDIIRDELVNGEVGSNISQNVLRLVQDEVAQALDER